MTKLRFAFIDYDGYVAERYAVETKLQEVDIINNELVIQAVKKSIKESNIEIPIMRLEKQIHENPNVWEIVKTWDISDN